MELRGEILKALQRATTTELWCEIGKRFRIQYGKIQMAFHNGRPSEYAELDIRIHEKDLRQQENKNT